jgi:hypothetical protein
MTLFSTLWNEDFRIPNLNPKQQSVDPLPKRASQGVPSAFAADKSVAEVPLPCPPFS